MKAQNILSVIKNDEDKILGKPIQEVERLFGQKSKCIKPYLREYTARRYFFGLIPVKLYLYLEDEIVTGYYIGVL